MASRKTAYVATLGRRHLYHKAVRLDQEAALLLERTKQLLALVRRLPTPARDVVAG